MSAVTAALAVFVGAMAAFAAPASAQTMPTSVGATLASGATLEPGQMLESSDGLYGLVMQEDGNLVEYYQSSATSLWASNTDGNPGAYLVLQADDGNLVLRDASGETALWSSGTTSSPGDDLSLQTDGNVVLYSGSDPVWASNTLTPAGSSLSPGQVLGPNQFLMSSNGEYRFLNAAGQGTLFVYTSAPACPMWTAPGFSQAMANAQITYTPTGQANSTLTMQDDGNLVLVAPSGAVTWSAGTSGSGNYLSMQDDGNLAVYSPSGTALWSSDTEGSRGWALCKGSVLKQGQWVETPVQSNGTHQGTLMLTNPNCQLELNSGKTWFAPKQINKNDIQAGAYANCYAVMQDDGNLVIMAPDFPGGAIPLWASNTEGNPGAMLIMQQGGCQQCYANASIYSPSGVLLAGYPDSSVGISITKQSSNKAVSVGKMLTTALLG